MKKKIFTLCLAVALAATAVVGGTLAYFTDTDDATNTFTVGNVDIELTEPEWDEEGCESAKLIPGREIVKDPTITVTSDSERAYTFMKVKLSDDFAQLLTDYAEFKDMDLTDAEQQKALINLWFKSTTSPKIMSVDPADNSVILGVLSPKDPGVSVTYFDAVTVPGDVDASMIDMEGTYEIYITAYAIQAEGFEGTHVDTAGNPDKNADRKAAYDALFPSAE